LRKNKLSADKECQWPVARCVEVIIMINESTFLSFANCKLLGLTPETKWQPLPNWAKISINANAS